MKHSVAYNFFFADVWRIAILVLIIIAIILFLLVIIKTFSKPKKFKLIFIVMINVMATSILNSAGFLLNWVDGETGELLFGKEEDFLCQAESFILFFSHTARETFVTLISVISFISFSFGDKFNIDNSKLSLIIFLLLGYLIPFIADIIYFILGIFGQSHYFCFTRASSNIKIVKICGSIHTYYVLFLVIISVSLMIYLVIATTYCSKEKINDAWANNDNGKPCINPILKKIIFFPIAQICVNSIALSYRIIDFNGTLNAKVLARPAAAISSLSSILYTIIFAVTNGIFSNSERRPKDSILSNSETNLVEL